MSRARPSGWVVVWSVVVTACSFSPGTVPECGNWVTEAAAGEECDDGNAACRDGCTPDCRLEPPDSLVVHLNTEATGDPGGVFQYAGPMALVAPSGCPFPNDTYDSARVLEYVPPGDGALAIESGPRTFVVDDASAASCAEPLPDFDVLAVRAGVPVYVLQQGSSHHDERAWLRGRFIARWSRARRAIPRGSRRPARSTRFVATERARTTSTSAAA